MVLVSCSGNETIENETDTSTKTYFPQNDGSDWETISPEELQWNISELNNLYQYLESKNTKGFIILKNGKIAIEKYFNNHSASKIWYWASAGKTLTSFTTGIAEEKGFLNINNPVSSYIGNNWTSASSEKEIQITCKHLLSMTSGLDDSLGNEVDPLNLVFKADAGSRWAYHNVYKKLQDVIAVSTNLTFEDFFNNELKTKIGMTGLWIQSNNFNVYWSTTRSMARFGLLAMNNGIWNSNQLINPSYFEASINSSQHINKAYGYLWWLNGKESFHLPNSQLEFNGKLVPNAPNDMYAALGKNDQKIYVVPSKELVIIRMGESAGGENFALSNFDNDLWELLNSVLN
jgi:CubicO group peptidase (beta-lactamase class C family)